MKKKILAVALALALCLSLLSTATLATDDSVDSPSESVTLIGDGLSEDTAFQIPNLATLEYYRDKINSTAESDAVYRSAYYRLTADINMSGSYGANINGKEVSWTPIGNTDSNAFTGVFDGNEKIVSGLYINDDTGQFVGLFGYLGNDGIIQDLTMTNGFVRGQLYVGGIAGRSYGTIRNCTNKNEVVATNIHAGGIAGACEGGTGKIINCYNTGNIEGYGYVGGISGTSQNNIEKSVNAGNVSGGTMWGVGGITGVAYAIHITECGNTGDITSAATGDYTYVGGIAGTTMGTSTINNCYNVGKISANETSSLGVGGILGTGSGEIQNSYSVGIVVGHRYVGGLVGFLTGGAVENCYYLNSIISNGIGYPANTTGGKDASSLASGEVAYLLQGTQSEQVWGQTIGMDDTPILTSDDAAKAYQLTFQAEGSADIVLYGNSGNVPAPADTPTREGYTFSGWEGYAENMQLTEDITFTATWESNYVPPVVPTYAITVESSDNGTVTASASRAAAGSRVALTVAPNEGYVLDTLTVTDGSGSALTLTETATGYTFTMPASAVTVTAIFAEINHANTCPSEHFIDVDLTSWYHDALDYVIENGLMIGTSDTTFEPGTTMNRAMLAQILYNMEGQSAVSGESTFTDVTAEDWYYDAVVWAAENGIVLGVGDTEFAPLDTISREQFAVMLYRYADFKGLDTSASGDLSAFTDAGSISDWATEAVTWAVGAEVLRGYGDGILNPIGGSMRAEAAQMLLNFNSIQ